MPRGLITDYPNFPAAELTCKCGCGQNLMAAGFMARLQMLRTKLGFPFPITSAYRCPDHNERVSSTGRQGPHTYGCAVDIAVSGQRAHQIIKHAAIDFTGIGIKQHGPHESRFIHLDTLAGSKRPWIWSYR